MALLDKLLNLKRDDLMAEPITPLDELHQNAKESMRHRMELVLLHMQAKACRQFEEIEGKRFKVDRSVGKNCSFVTCRIEDGDVLERAGVVFMIVQGQLQGDAAKELSPGAEKLLMNAKYYAIGYELLGMIKRFMEMLKDTGVTQIDVTYKYGIRNSTRLRLQRTLEFLIHPRNPHVPTLNGSYRYFEAETQDGMKLAWHGGGHDLKPIYVVEEDIIHFHKTIKDACDKHNPEYYPKFKKACDQFFYNSVRGERQGVGGILFDGLSTPDLEGSFSFLVDCCEAVLPCYVPLLEKHMKDSYTEKEKEWQKIRRGRIVEFTFMDDRGTKFGLAVPGIDIESMFLTLPPNAIWKYRCTPAVGTKEHEFLQLMKNPRDWV